jgi:hypothetical protein
MVTIDLHISDFDTPMYICWEYVHSRITIMITSGGNRKPASADEADVLGKGEDASAQPACAGDPSTQQRPWAQLNRSGA